MIVTQGGSYRPIGLTIARESLDESSLQKLQTELMFEVSNIVGIGCNRHTRWPGATSFFSKPVVLGLSTATGAREPPKELTRLPDQLAVFEGAIAARTDELNECLRIGPARPSAVVRSDSPNESIDA